MGKDAADAMLESVSPIPWTLLATKDDIAHLDARLDRLVATIGSNFAGLEGRLALRFTGSADD